MAALGTLAVLVFTWLSIQQVDDEHALTREGQVTDRYNAAVTNIGDDSPEVRLGGIYALQRIMEDSPRDQPSIVNVLSTYIRDHTERPTSDASGKEPTTDVQAALTALGMRDPDHDGAVRVNLRDASLVGADLSGVLLVGADLSGVDLSRADLMDANLFRADLKGAHLNHAELTSAHLNHADLIGADLTGANLNSADLSGAYLLRADLSGADLNHVHLIEANLDSADLRGADLRKRDLRGAFVSEDELRDVDWL